MVYNTEKMLKEHRDKITDADAKQVETAIEEVKKAMNEGGADKLNTAVDGLTTASHKLAEAMYKTQSTAQGGPTPGATDGAHANGASGTQEAPKDNVVDAEFVDVEDKK